MHKKIKTYVIEPPENGTKLCTVSENVI